MNIFPTTDGAKAKILLVSTIASISLNAYLLWPTVWGWANANANAASWVQAVGGILTIAIAVYAVGYQVRLASIDRSCESKKKFVHDLASAARIVEQAQMYSLKIAMKTTDSGTLDAQVMAMIYVETDTLFKHVSIISPMTFADTPVFDDFTTAQSAAHLLFELVKSYSDAVSASPAQPIPPTTLHIAALDLSDKFRSSALNIRSYASKVELG